MPIAQTLSSPRFRTAEAVTKADRAKSVFAKYIIGLIILAFFCCLFYIWSRIQIVNVGYEINRELTHKEKLIEENKKLSLEIATLKSPVRLESLAKNDYHMDLPQESQVLRDMKDLQIAAQPDSK
ncbi:MAG: cell division protein FtsL, partial [Deltaproteobacteria bacterium]|nr:cell division protein FtsL [Deltaproteobacteria bacterium]